MAKHSNGKGVLEKRLKGPAEYIQRMPEVGNFKVNGSMRCPASSVYMKIQEATVGSVYTGYFVIFNDKGNGVKLYVGPKTRSLHCLEPMKDLYNALTAYATRCNS